MKKLSTGDDSTLSSYRKLALTLFGENSQALNFLDQKIIERGEDYKIILDEIRMIYLLSQIALDKPFFHHPNYFKKGE